MEGILGESPAKPCPRNLSLPALLLPTSGRPDCSVPTAQRPGGHARSVTVEEVGPTKLPTPLFHYRENPDIHIRFKEPIFLGVLHTPHFLFLSQPSFHRWFRIFFPSVGFIFLVSQTRPRLCSDCWWHCSQPASGPAGPTLSRNEEAYLGPQSWRESRDGRNYGHLRQVSSNH